MKAAQDYVDVCCRHIAYLSGRGDIEDAIQDLVKGSSLNPLLAI